MSHKKIVELLMDWFGQNARDLPWRRTTDPYAIWISEVMLQQTQVKSVFPYWEKWMRALPSIESLAQARPERIHKLWEGLGYYSRVRNLQKAARLIVEEHGGRFPRKYEQVLTLPGIGRYTAGAICSIAFNQPRPILDGNVIRVLSRLFGIGGNPRRPRTNARLWDLAEELVREAVQVSARERHRPHSSQTNGEISKSLASCSQFNQSLMELGALVCTPRRPKCAQCPMAGACIANKRGNAEALPNLGPRIRPTPRWFVAFVVSDRGRFLVRQRPAGLVNAHLWEFPSWELAKKDPKKAFQQLLGVRAKNLEKLCRIKHTITRYRITLEVFQSKMGSSGSRRRVDGRWLSLRALRRLAFSSAHKKILKQLVCGSKP